MSDGVGMNVLGISGENVEMEISDEDWIILSKEAHRRDITFNQLVNDLIREYIRKIDGSISIQNKDLNLLPEEPGFGLRLSDQE